MHFYLTFDFFEFKVVNKIKMNLFKGSKDFVFLNFEKYKLALSKLDSSWDNSYCMRLVIVSSSVNIGNNLQPLGSVDNFFLLSI